MTARIPPAGTIAAIFKRDKALAAVVLGAAGAYGALYLIWAATTQGLRVEGASDWLGSDFFVYWAAAKYVIAGHIDRLYDIAAFTEFQLGIVDKGPGYFSPWPYPPHGLFPVLGFGLLPYAPAFLLWIGLTYAVYALAATGGRLADRRVAVLAAAPATVVTVIAGQNGFLTAGLLAGGVFLLDRRPVTAGILFGLLTFKPQMGILVPIALIAAGLWRPFISAAITAVAAAGLSAALFGMEIWPAYLDFMPRFREIILSADRAFFEYQPTAFMAARIWGLAAAPAYIVQTVTALIVAGGVFAVFRRGENRTMQAAALFLGTPLAAPYFFNYDMPIVSIAVIMMAAEGLKTGFRPGEKPLLIVVWLLPVLVMKLNPLGLPIAPFALAGLFFLAGVRATGWTEMAPAAPEQGVETATRHGN